MKGCEMALRKWTNTGYKQLTDREIKAEIMRRWGLDPKSAADQKTYKRRYDVYALQTRNYAKLQALEERPRANESLLRTLRRQQAGIALTAEQEGILATTSQNAQQFARRVERGDQKLIDAGILNLERQFDAFLTKNTRGYAKQYEEFRTREVTTVAIVDEDGQILATYNITEGEAPPANLPDGARIETTTTREIRTDQTVEEVKAFLESLADDLHSWQKSRMEGNRAVYNGKNRRSVGS